MKGCFTFIFLVISLSTVNGQVIPDLTTTDNFRPYLTEEKKREYFQSENKEPTARTSEDLYPEKYKYVKKDYLEPLKSTSTDPANAFKNNAVAISHTNPSNPLPLNVYNNSQSIQQRNLAIVEADMKAYTKRKQKHDEIMESISKEFPSIQYTLGVHNGEAVHGFEQAYAGLHDMLMGRTEIDFVKAVFMVESAYDKTLTWEEFNGMFNSSKSVIERLLIQDGLDPNDNIAKIMSIFKYMADTTKVFFNEKEKPVITKPMLYDYEDYAGKEDASKVFVSKLLRTGTGQCMSLPMLYFLFSKALKTENVHIALAPQHSFIRFKDDLGNWNNIELTGRMFTTDDFQWQGGFVKSNQVRSGIYLKPLTDQEVLSYLLTTLTLTYIKSFGIDDRAYGMALTAKEYFPNSLTANSIIAGYYKDLFNNVLRQYNVHHLTQRDLDNDKNAQAINTQRNEAFDYLYDDLGYEKIPDWHYQQWLSGVKEAAKVRQHIVKRRQLEQQLKR